MHIPDGIFPAASTSQLLIYTAITIILLAVLYYKNKKKLTMDKIPLIAMFIVATVIVQLIDFPLGVACIHVSLIALIALYDPWFATIIFAFVTVIQAFMGEGGISTLGVNLLNLAIIAPWLSYGIYHLFKKFNKQAAIFLAGCLTITGLGLIVSVEYAISGSLSLITGLVIILPIEIGVGILEGFVTLFVMNVLKNIKPELVPVLTDE